MKDHDVHSLSHTKWECKYHIVFASKYRRKVFYGQKRYEIGQILRELCRWKQVNLLEAEACPDHIHILVEVPPKIRPHRPHCRSRTDFAVLGAFSAPKLCGS